MSQNAKHELWHRGVLTWKLHEGQRKVYNLIQNLDPKVREVVLLISRRWGKSYLGCVMALEDCLRNPGGQVFIVGPTIKQTRRILTPIIRKITEDAPDGLIQQTISDLTWRVGDSTLLLGAFDTAFESFRGMEASSIYFEETGLSGIEDYDYVMKSVFRPTLMHTRGRMYHNTTPPKDLDHPFIFDTMVSAAANKSLFIYTIEDNPLLSKEDIESEIIAAGGRESQHCKRELFCQIERDDQRLILPEFDENRHVKTLDTPPHTFFLTSIDFGGVKDNHAELVCYYDFARNKVCFTDEEWLEINTGTNEIIQRALSMEQRVGVKWVRGNPRRIVDAPGQTHVDLKRMGFICDLPAKGKDSVEDGIQAMRVALLRDQIEIDPRCTKLIETCKYASWNHLRKDFQRTPSLGHCDMLAAMSYAFRHLDKLNNPYPHKYSGLSPEDYSIPTYSDNSNTEAALFSAIYDIDD